MIIKIVITLLVVGLLGFGATWFATPIFNDECIPLEKPVSHPLFSFSVLLSLPVFDHILYYYSVLRGVSVVLLCDQAVPVYA